MEGVEILKAATLPAHVCIEATIKKYIEERYERDRLEEGSAVYFYANFGYNVSMKGVIP